MRPNSYYEKKLNFVKGKLKGVGYISTIYFCDKVKGITYRNISNNTNKCDKQKQ